MQTGTLWRNRSLAPSFARRPNTRNMIRRLHAWLVCNASRQCDELSSAYPNQSQYKTFPRYRHARTLSRSGKHRVMKSMMLVCSVRWHYLEGMPRSQVRLTKSGPVKEFSTGSGQILGRAGEWLVQTGTFWGNHLVAPCFACRLNTRNKIRTLGSLMKGTGTGRCSMAEGDNVVLCTDF